MSFDTNFANYGEAIRSLGYSLIENRLLGNDTNPILKIETSKAAGVHLTIILNTVCLVVAIIFYCLCLRRMRIFKKGGFFKKKSFFKSSEEKETLITGTDNNVLNSTLANPINISNNNNFDQLQADLDDSEVSLDLGKAPEQTEQENISNTGSYDSGESFDSASPMIPDQKKKGGNFIFNFIKRTWANLWYEQQYHSFGAFYGHQITLYLFLSKQMTIALGICSFLSIIFLLPLHLTGDLPVIPNPKGYGNVEVVKDNYFLVYTTISMVSNSPVKLYVHVGLSLIYILIILLFLRRFTESRLVKQYPLEGKRLLSQYSARLDGLPVNLLSNDILKKACNLPEIFNGTVANSRISFATSERIKLEKQFDEVCKTLRHYEYIQTKKKRRPFMCLCFRGSSCFRSRTDAIAHYEKRKHKLEAKMRKWDEKFLKNPKGTGRAYLLFQSAEARKAAIKKGGRGVYTFSIDIEGKDKPAKLNNISFTVTGAAEPSDILWENSSLANEWRFVRVVAINFFIIIYLLIFTSPLALLSSVQTFLLYLPKNIHTILDSIRTMGGPIGDLIYQYLPTLLLLIVSSTLPYVIPFLAKLERHYTYSQYSLGTIVRLYLYLLLTTMLLPTFALTSIDGIYQYLQLRDISVTLKQLFLPGSGVFFVNYTIQYLYWGVIIDLLRIMDVFRYIYKSIGAVGEQEKREAAQVAEFDFPLEYGYLLSFLAIVFAYSIFSPIIICLGFLYFFCKYKLDVRNIIFLCSKNKNSRHNVLPDVSNYRKNIMALAYIVFTVVLIFELLQILFYVREREACYIHLTIMITAFFATVIYMIYWGLTFTINPMKKWGPQTGKNENMTESLLTAENSEIHVLEAADQQTFDVAYLPPFSPFNIESSIDAIEMLETEVKKPVIHEGIRSEVIIDDSKEEETNSENNEALYSFSENEYSQQEVFNQEDTIDAPGE